jgi:hypothetical protein
MLFSHRLLSVAAVAVLASAAHADIIYVDGDNCPGPGSGTEADPFCSIQTGIDAAVDTDEIVVAPGTYFETFNFLGKAITVRSAGGPDLTVVDGQQTGSVVTCTSGEGPDTVLQGFTITGGTGDSSQMDTRGGGMLNEFSDPTVSHCVFLDNTAALGAGMHNEEADPIVADCVFMGNQTEIPGIGGAILSDLGSPLVTDCLFIGNSGGIGGGMFIGGGSATIIGCALLDNAASVSGGGIASANSDTIVVNCVLAGNSAEASDGGGIYHGSSGATLQLINCTLTRNDAFDDGGGIYLTLHAHLEVDNSILWGNTDADGSGRYSQIHSGVGPATVHFSCIKGGWPGVGNIDADPVFVDPDSGDFRSSPDSPCIDAGDNTAVPQDIDTDLDGNPRFLEIPETPDTGYGDLPIVDMGAYESLGGGCLAITSQEVVCHGDGTTFTINAEGLDACTGGTTMVTFTGMGGAVGEDFCATLLVNSNGGGFCCSTELCVPVPDCSAAALPCGLDHDGVVGITDFLLLLGAWGPCPDCADCPADLDGDCAVGVTDLLVLLANWGPCF